MYMLDAVNEQIPSSPDADLLYNQYDALLGISEAISAHRDLNELFQDLAQRLPRIVPFDFINLVLHDPTRELMRLHALVAPESSTIRPGLELPVDQSPAGWVWKSQQPLMVEVEEAGAESRFPKLIPLLRENDVQSYCIVPLTTAVRRLGAMGFGSFERKSYPKADFDFMQQVAKHVAVAIDNTLHFEQAQSVQKQLKEEHDRLRLLLDVNNTVVSVLDLRELLNAVSASLRRLMPHEYASISLYDPETERLQIHALDFPLSKGLIGEGLWVTIKGAAHGRALTSRQPVFLTRGDVEKLDSDIARRFLAEGLQSTCILPLISRGRPLGTLAVASLHEEIFPEKDADLLQHVANQIAIAVENALAFGQVVNRAERLTEEKIYLQDEIRAEHNFEEMIAESAALKNILRGVQTVAPTDSTVLIQGETGTGKELIARAIHNLSARRDRTLVKVNCAAIPTGLLESELFGHERGAFTGAIAQRIGRFELANGGTLFLDEVGDIALELQPKLLRVLQEQEFERLGSTRTLRVDVRLVAATNSNLAQKVEQKQFRSDLYYRLNVFPVTIPPLRERTEDIPILVRYFAQKYAQRMKKSIDTIPTKSMRALVDYHWPGNVRELENFIERSVILSRGSQLEVPLSEFKRQTKATLADFRRSLSTLEDAEREHILRALKETNWILGGPTGAAYKLGMKRTTLQSKMRKLGIARPQ
jgi:formate hydrogenlyase transcriptional activator